MVRLLCACLSLLAVARPAAAFPPGGFEDGISAPEMADFYRDNPEVKKISDRLKKEAERKRAEGQEEPPQRGLDDPPDPEAQERINSHLAQLNPAGYMRDLVAEYAEEKGQFVEDNIWQAGEVKATPEVRTVYRNYLRAVWNKVSGMGNLARPNMTVTYVGTPPNVYPQVTLDENASYASGGNAGHDQDSSNHLNIIRHMLETPRGYEGFPTANMGYQPEPILATYGGWHIKMKTGVTDICVFSHEMFHWTDDVQGGVDGESRRTSGGPEAHAYAQMCREI